MQLGLIFLKNSLDPSCHLLFFSSLFPGLLYGAVFPVHQALPAVAFPFSVFFLFLPSLTILL